jgi:hypothetical protein
MPVEFFKEHPEQLGVDSETGERFENYDVMMKNYAKQLGP